MKLKKITSLAIALVLAFSFVGCSKSDASVENSKEESKNEVSQDKGGSTEEDKNKEDNKDKNNADDKKSEEEKEIVVYSYDLEKESLVPNNITIKNDTPNKDDIPLVVFDNLKSLGVIPKDASMNSFEISNVENVDTGLLDVNSKFINSNLGSGAESLMLDAVAKSFMENFNVDQIQLTVDGKDYESGHIYLGKGDFLAPGKESNENNSADDSSNNSGEDVEAINN